MTNPIAKAIAKIGVAMGYGQLEDYKGSSVEDMLESFASIAQEKGPASGGMFIATITVNDSEITSDKSESEILDAFNSGKTVFAYVPEYGFLIPLTSSNTARYEMSSIRTSGMKSITAVVYIVAEVAENKSCTILTESISITNE